MMSTPCSKGLVINGVENVPSATRSVGCCEQLQMFFVNHISS